jgi:hypothetical protein
VRNTVFRFNHVAEETSIQSLILVSIQAALAVIEESMRGKITNQWYAFASSDLGTYYILLLYFVQTAKLVNIHMEIITAIISTKLGNRFRLWHLLKINYYYIDIWSIKIAIIYITNIADYYLDRF